MGKRLIDLEKNDNSIFERIKELHKEIPFLEYKEKFQNSNSEFMKDVLAMANAYPE